MMDTVHPWGKAKPISYMHTYIDICLSRLAAWQAIASKVQGQYEDNRSKLPCYHVKGNLWLWEIRSVDPAWIV